MAQIEGSIDGVEAFVFDVFGSVVNYHKTVAEEVLARSRGSLNAKDAADFALEWRKGYYRVVAEVVSGKPGPIIVDEMHRQLLDEMLASDRWSHLNALWSEEEKSDFSLVWHRLEGWPDSSPGLHELKKHAIIGTLSNGNVRLLVDMAKHADLPWDVVFSSEFVGAFKPTPKMYQSAAKYLALPLDRVALVAAHINDLRGAARAGLRTVYIPRSTEDAADVSAAVKVKDDGGDIDLISRSGSILEVAKYIGSRNASKAA